MAHRKPKPAVVAVRLTQDESEHLDKLSHERDLPVSTLVRQILRGEEKPLPTQVTAVDPSETKRDA
jgi:hypothetical protein